MTTDLIVNSDLQGHQSDLTIGQELESLGLLYFKDALTGTYSANYRTLEFTNDILMTLENDWRFTRLVCQVYLPSKTVARVHRSSLIDRVAQVNSRCPIGFFSIYESENRLKFNYVLPIEYECANLVGAVVKRVIDNSIDQMCKFAQYLLIDDNSCPWNMRFKTHRQCANDPLFESNIAEVSVAAISRIDSILTAAYRGRGLKLHQSGARRLWKQTLGRRRISNSEIELKLDAQSHGVIDVIASMKAEQATQVNPYVLEFIALFNEGTVPFVHMEYVQQSHKYRVVGQMLYTYNEDTLSEEMVNRMLGICSNTLWSVMPHIRSVEEGLKSPYKAFAEYEKACQSLPECLSSIRHWSCFRDLL